MTMSLLDAYNLINPVVTLTDIKNDSRHVTVLSIWCIYIICVCATGDIWTSYVSYDNIFMLFIHNIDIKH